MAIATQGGGPSGGALTEVLELILDRGVVIDVFVRVSLVGIEVLTIDARIVVASVDTYLRYAEAVGRINLDSRKAGVPELVAGRKANAAIESAIDKYGGVLERLLGEPEPAPAIQPEKREGER
jgi:hypothetical protein